MAKTKHQRMAEVDAEVEDILDESATTPDFTCNRREREVSKPGCYEAFLHIHAYELKKSPCWNCRQGSKNRLSYVWEDESQIPPEMVEYMLPRGERKIPMTVVMAFLSDDKETVTAWRRLRRLKILRRR